jgi:tetratricopeptide (TPR) repeat protein
MIEKPGYGSRIYIQRKRFNPWPYILIALILIGSGFIFNYFSKTPGKPGEVPSGMIKKNKKVEKNNPHLKKPAPSAYKGSRQGNENFEDETQIGDESKLPVPNTGGRLAEAHKLYTTREYEKALVLYKEFLSQDPGAVQYAGLCCYWLEDYESAYQYLLEILTNDRSNFIARKFMALTCYKMDDLSNCLNHLEIAISQVNDPELMTLYKKLKREKRVMDGYGDQQKLHFKVQFSKLEHTGIENTVLDILEEAYRTIGSAFNFYPSTSITVILYNEKGFFDVTRAPGWAGGLYDGKIRIPIKGIEGQEALLKRILFHEFTHALVNSITTNCPVWFNEGLAEYFSEDEELLKLGEQVGQLIPLQYLERGFPSGNPRLVALAYLESFTAVSDLIEKHGLFRIKEFLEALAKGTSMQEAFRSSFYITYDEFAAKWGKKD